MQNKHCYRSVPLISLMLGHTAEDHNGYILILLYLPVLLQKMIQSN
jgi:hypothetical protein